MEHSPIESTSTNLFFYKQPFHQLRGCSWVYDDASNFVFQFESEFDENGEYVKGVKELQNAVIESINSESHKPILGLSLEVDKEDPNFIYNGKKLFIVVRGWGNLTGTGAHNLPAEKASEIQDKFRDWLIKKLSV